MTNGTLHLPTTPPPELAEDEKSLSEAMGLATGVDLSSREAMNRFNELLHKDRVNTHLHRCAVTGIYVISIAAAAMFIVVVAHHLRPGIWLTPPEVASLQGFLFSGGMGAVLAAFSKAVFKPGTDPKN
jgi:hypothetical protein